VKRRRFKPLVWPVALLLAGGLTACLAEASATAASTFALFGTLKLVSDLTLLIALVWMIIAGVRFLWVRQAGPRA